MHDTNTNVNDMCGAEEECNNAVTDPRVASRAAQALKRGGPSLKVLGPET